MAKNSWTVRPLATALGAEITGVRLAEADSADIAEIKRLLEENKVIFFPGQHMSSDEHVAYGRHFGHLEGHPNLKDRNAKEHPEIFRLKASEGGIADEWHTDLTFLPNPALMSILNMKECPEVGGDTMWTSLTAAYEDLSPPLQDLCDGLSALHDAHPHDRADRMHIHPLVRIDPATSKKALYVNEHFTRRIVEMNAQESAHFLHYLTEWVKRPPFTVRYNWTAGTLCMWDNRFTQHYVVNDVVGERIIERVTVMGDTVVGNAPRWQPYPENANRGAMTRHDRQLIQHLDERQQQRAAE